MKTVCIQGLGFVGSAMAIAVADSKKFQVIGVDLDTKLGRERIEAINKGEFPFPSADKELVAKATEAHKRGNLTATADNAAFAKADVILVGVPFDVKNMGSDTPTLAVEPFTAAIESFAKVMKEDALVIVETTLPPGACRNIVYPIIAKHFAARGFKKESIRLAHSYERVMPGADYFNSIVNAHRSYAGYDDASAKRCEEFLSHVINVKKWPLTSLSSLEASEIGKLMENSYRAVNIAFIEEWAELAEELGVNLYEVIGAIRQRPTHNNIRQPGFGVGGYCLPKDPLLARLACESVLKLSPHAFPFCDLAVKTNRYMPLRCLKRLEEQLGSLKGKKILLLGASYRQEVADLRYSPSLDFIVAAEKKGASVTCHDPLVESWDEIKQFVSGSVEKLSAKGFDAVVIAVPHPEYRAVDMAKWLSGSGALMFDACGILTNDALTAIRKQGLDAYVIGRGEVAA